MPGQFGMDDFSYQQFEPMLNAPNGIIYITGPHRKWKVYDTLYGSGISVPEKCEYFHHRRPGRKESSGHQPDPGESGGRD